MRTAKLIAGDGAGLNAPFPEGFGRSDEFGTSVAISGDTVAIGAPGHAHAGRQVNSGAVYVFQKVNGIWIQQAELLSPTPFVSNNFGLDQTIGISGDAITISEDRKTSSLLVSMFSRGLMALGSKLPRLGSPTISPSSWLVLLSMETPYSWVQRTPMEEAFPVPAPPTSSCSKTANGYSNRH